MVSISFIVPRVNTGDGRNRRDNAHKNCDQCHYAECCKTDNYSNFHIFPPRLNRLLKSIIQ